MGSMHSITRRLVGIRAGALELEGALEIPVRAGGIVLFAHGSGSSRMSPRNRFVAGELHRRGIATLLFDLLIEAEDAQPAKRFDIELLAERLRAAVRWTADQPSTAQLPIGLFGASTGAAAALEVAAALGPLVRAVVSRGGRPDLASSEVLAAVTAPTLLIVGGEDTEVIGMNAAALGELRCINSLQVIPGATHLFEEPGALESVASLACEWFGRHLLRSAASSSGPTMRAAEC